MLMYCLLIFELCIADLVSYTFFPGVNARSNVQL